MKTEFYTINGIYSAELTEKKSRFIAHVTGISSKAEVEEFFRSVRTRYKDARHNVPAYRFGIDSIEEWANDDGEPAGTAGKPILEVIRNSGITNIAVMVTRYFGGILLGTGGLVRAYGGVTAQLFSNVPQVKKYLHRQVFIETDYKNLGKVKRFLEDIALFKDMACAQNVVFTYQVPLESLESVKFNLTELCSGQIVIQEGEDVFVTV